MLLRGRQPRHTQLLEDRLRAVGGELPAMHGASRPSGGVVEIAEKTAQSALPASRLARPRRQPRRVAGTFEQAPDDAGHRLAAACGGGEGARAGADDPGDAAEPRVLAARRRGSRVYRADVAVVA